MKQEFPIYLFKIEIQKNLPASRIGGEISLDTHSWAEIIDSMLGIFKPPLSIGLINAVRFTLSFPFQTKDYSRVLIINFFDKLFSI